MFRSDAISKKEFKKLGTDELRNNFVFNLFEKDQVKSVHSYYDRVILFGANPVAKTLDLSNGAEIHASYLLENREMGIVNLAGTAEVIVDGKTFTINKNEAIYIGKGKKDVKVKSVKANDPALLYSMCTPAHKELPTEIIDFDRANKIILGDQKTLNKRTIFQLIHPSIIETCQLSMGITCLEPGSAWNTCPPHTHDRRMEAYLYFDLENPNIVFHFMGEKDNTRHVILKNNDAVINPPWSVHFGTATSNYNFVWAMAGENKVFDDMDHIKLDELK